jgi:methyltransferase (TIGR00027 family)
MSTAKVVRNISDTARWAAVFRARETERRDALFRDPFAQRLAGARGEEITAALHGNRHDWAWVTRTYLFDQFLKEELQYGIDMVVNLAAGLDARPYRLDLPATLQWIEVDLPDLLNYKQEVLQNDKPACILERIPLDLSDGVARRELFAQLGRRAKNALVITEGLLIYLTEDRVGQLAEDLARAGGFQRWLTDLASPRLVRMIARQVGEPLGQAGATLQFGPKEGPEFFASCGWKPIDVRSTLQTAARLKRAPLLLRLLAFLPDSKGAGGKGVWSGACLLARM